jgi:hypothetical protein
MQSRVNKYDKTHAGLKGRNKQVVSHTKTHKKAKIKKEPCENEIEKYERDSLN